MSTRRKMLLALVLLCPLTASAQDRNEEFFAAARKGDAAAVKALLEAGVDVNAKTRYGATALSYACDKGHVEVVKLLIERGADVNVKDTFYGATPLDWALNHDATEVVLLLVQKGANEPASALELAVKKKDARLGRAILEVTAQNDAAVRLYHRLGFRRRKTVYKTVDLAQVFA